MILSDETQVAIAYVRAVTNDDLEGFQVIVENTDPDTLLNAMLGMFLAVLNELIEGDVDTFLARLLEPGVDR